MNKASNKYQIKNILNTVQQSMITLLLIGALGCSKWLSNTTQPEIMRSIDYREDEYDGLYDIEYENNIPYDWDDECIMLSRQERETSLRNTKKIASDTLSPKKQ